MRLRGVSWLLLQAYSMCGAAAVLEYDSVHPGVIPGVDTVRCLSGCGAFGFVSLCGAADGVWFIWSPQRSFTCGPPGCLGGRETCPPSPCLKSHRYGSCTSILDDRRTGICIS